MKSSNQLKRFIISVILIIVIMIVVSSTVLSFGMVRRGEEYMLGQTSALMSVNAEQLRLNINSYLDDIEGNVALLFSDDQLIRYDESTTTMDEYDRIQIENQIAGRIADLGALENYSDFCVVYADDKSIGWKSKTTQNMYSDKSMYADMSSRITNERTLDGWAFGVLDNYERMYYVKRYNPNAIIVTSFYTRELERSFDYPEELKGLCIRLIDDTGMIVYSSESDQIGTPALSGEKTYVDNHMSVNAITEDSLINTGFCENGWMVICTVSRQEMMNEFYVLRRHAIIFSVIVSLFALISSIVIVYRLSRPMDGLVDELSQRASVDALSGVMNRRSFEDMVKDYLEKEHFPHYVFFMFDIDNFKMINDNLGHDYGDTVIRNMGALLGRVAVSGPEREVSIGRLGGDEFAMFVGYTGEEYLADAEEICRNILIEFRSTIAKEANGIPVSLSAGVATGEDADSHYRNLYMAADSALYESKESGKDRYVFYRRKESLS